MNNYRDFDYESRGNRNGQLNNRNLYYNRNSYGRGNGRMHINGYGNTNDRQQYNTARGNRERQGSFKQARGAYSTNMLERPQCPMYVMGKFKDVEVPILLDTGSTVTIINEEIWNLVKEKNETLKEVSFAVRSVTKQAVEILGETEIKFSLQLSRRRSMKEFVITALVARGVIYEAIMGLDFMLKYKAVLNTVAHNLSLHTNGTKTLHNLIRRKVVFKSINVIVTEKMIIEPRMETRIACELEEEIEDGVSIYLEPDENFLNNIPIVLAGAVDIVNKNEVTTQFINPTWKLISIRPGTIIGHAEIMEEEATDKRHETVAGSTDWIKTVDVGKDGFTSTEKKRIHELLADYSDIFCKGEYDLRRTNVIEHGIDLNGPKPKRCGPRPLNPTSRVELEKQLKEMMDHDMIQPSRSEFACPVVLVKKKNGSIRFCCDFRRLNDVTRRDSYPLPKINELINTLSGAKLFTTLDFRSGYHQVALKPEDRHKTAFAAQFGLFEWKVMAMGLCNSPGSFSRLMDLVMIGLNWHGVLVYLDDLLIFGKDYEEHFDRLKEVFQRLRKQI